MANDRNVRVTLKDVRLSYPHIFNKQTYEANEPSFSASFIVDPSTKVGKANKAAMDAAIKAVIAAGFPDKAPKEDKRCWVEGDEDKPEQIGMFVAKASNKKRFPILARDGKTPLTEEDGKPYGGCYVNVVIDVYPNTKYKRISASLMGIQFLRDGEAFGAPPLPDDAFEDMGDEEDDL
jgi:hypothetical protein